jgi:hypothetical protein
VRLFVPLLLPTHHRRLKLERFGPGRDLAPYTPEEAAEIRSGVSEWEVQSRRIREQSRASPAPLNQEQQSKRDKRLESLRDYRKAHRAEKLGYDRRRYKKRKSFRQVRAEVEAQRQREREALGQPREADVSQREREQPEAGQIFPSVPKK